MHLGLFTSLLSLFIHSDVSTTWTEDLTILFPVTALEECSELFVEKKWKKKMNGAFFFTFLYLHLIVNFYLKSTLFIFIKK